MKSIIHKVVKLLKNLALNEISFCHYDRAIEENKIASIIIARRSITLLAESLDCLSSILKEVEYDEYLVKAYEELKIAYKILQEIAYGDIADIELLKSVSYVEQKYPLLLDEAHYRIHNSIRYLRKSRVEIFKEYDKILDLLEKARRETMPSKLCRLALDILIAKSKHSSQ